MLNFKKADGLLYFIIGIFVMTICIPSDNIYVNTIIVPIGFILLIVSAVITIKNYKRGKESNQTYESQNKHNSDNHNKL